MKPAHMTTSVVCNLATFLGPKIHVSDLYNQATSVIKGEQIRQVSLYYLYPIAVKFGALVYLSTYVPLKESNALLLSSFWTILPQATRNALLHLIFSLSLTGLTFWTLCFLSNVLNHLRPILIYFNLSNLCPPPDLLPIKNLNVYFLLLCLTI